MRTRRHSLTPGFTIILLALLQAGCDRRGIEVYSIEKEHAGDVAPAAPSAPAIRLPEPPPNGWKPVDPAGGPRVASFRIPAAEDGAESADMSVIVFPGAAGGLLANVNRWRGEMAQPAVSESELADATERREVGGHTLYVVDAASEERRTVGAILPVGGETWFFKLTGPEAVVVAQREAFVNYLDGLEIVAAATTAQAPASDPPLPARPSITYKVPDGWVEGELTSMRAASFTVNGDGGREADIAVIPLGGSGGAQLAIINQWRSTLRLGNATRDQLPGMIESADVGGRSFKLVDFVSGEAMLENDRKARIVVAFAAVGEHTWFFKIAGEDSLVAEQKAVLLEFLKSVEFGTSP